MITSRHHRSAAVIVLAAVAALFMAGPVRAAIPPEGPSASAAEKPAAPQKRFFQINLRYWYHQIPKSLQAMEYWFPFPFSDSAQTAHNIFVMSPYEMQSETDPDTGNIIYHMFGGPRGGVPMRASFRMDIERSRVKIDPAPAAPLTTPEQDRAARERWMRPERLSPLSREVRSRASRATGGKRKPLEKARAIFDYIANNMTFVSDVSRLPGSGQGDVQFALREMRGSAVDAAALFVGLCRAADIPARTVMGIQIPEGMRSGSINGYHGWAEFHLDGIGWVPVDPAGALKHPSRRDEFFAQLDAGRVALSIGRDINLRPPQKADPLNYFVNPHWEGEGRAMPSPWVEIEFTEMDSIPPMQAVPSDAGTPVPPPAGPS